MARGEKRMKRIAIAVVVLLIAVMNSAVYAERIGKRGLKSETEVEVGIKSLFDTFKVESSSGGGGTDNIAVLLGPTVAVKFSNRLFIEAAYLLTATDYISTSSFTKTKNKRTDIDLAIGYMFKPEFGVQAGYKNTELKQKLVVLGVETDMGKATNSGAYVGILGSTSAAKETSLYWKLNYLRTRAKADVLGVSASEDNPGWTLEVGIKDYTFHDKIAINFGYLVETTEGKDSKNKNTFSGVTLGAKYVF